MPTKEKAAATQPLPNDIYLSGEAVALGCVPRPRLLTLAEVTFTVECEPEDLAIRGNAIASGDPAVDKETEDWIYAELAAGNEWAWCSIRVTARWGEFQGRDYLGGCSYKSEKDFYACDDYYSQMKSEALDDLNEEIASTYRRLASLL